MWIVEGRFQMDSRSTSADACLRGRASKYECMNLREDENSPCLLAQLSRAVRVSWIASLDALQHEYLLICSSQRVFLETENKVLLR
jgi:hypothetical protein